MSDYISSINTDGLQLNKERILAKKGKLVVEMIDHIDDKTWIDSAFLMGSIELEADDETNRNYSTALFKYTDSSLGGSLAINPRPQFTRYADIRVKGIVSGRRDTTLDAEGKLGMGRYYSEAIDDTSQVINLRFGMPEFNSLTSFFTGFFNSSLARVARTGRTDPGFFFTLGQAVGLVVNLVYWPLLALHVIGVAAKFALKMNASRFYYLKPAMPVYWQAVTTMVNQIAVNRGLFPIDGLDTGGAGGITDTTAKIGKEGMKVISDIMPDIFKANGDGSSDSFTGGIDMYAVANRAGRLKQRFEKDLAEKLHAGDEASLFAFAKSIVTGAVAVEPKPGRTLNEIIAKWASSEAGMVTNTADGAVPSHETEMSLRQRPGEPGVAEKPTPSGFLEYLRAEYDDASQFASFRVDYTGPADESFSNSVTESDLASKFNNLSSQGKAAQFTFAGGNIAGGTAIGDLAQGALGAVKDFAKGALDMFQMSGLMALGGSAFVDIPKHWESSTATLPRMSYSMQLVSPYGNQISQMTNLYIPLCMLLAGALPLMTGRQSYTSPFILELYDQGRCQTRLGMIDSLSVSRGTSNLGFNKDNNAMSIDISFSVVDLSSVLSIPITTGFSFNPLEGLFDDDNVYTDYINVLSSMSLNQQIYAWPKFKLNLAKKIRVLSQMNSKAYWSSYVHNSPAGILDIFFKGTDR